MTALLNSARPVRHPAGLAPHPGAVAPGIDGRRQRYVDRIKKAANHTPLVTDKLLGTENTGQSFDPAMVVGQIKSFHLNLECGGSTPLFFARLDAQGCHRRKRRRAAALQSLTASGRA